MKTFHAAILLLVCAVAASFAEETNTLPSTITVDGLTYSNVTWRTVTPATVSIFHQTGVASILLQKLPPELQKQFGYDPKKAAEYQVAVAAAQAKAARKAAELAARPPPPGSIAFLDANNGFRDVKFGQAPDEIEGLVLIEKHGLDWTYSRPLDKLSIGIGELLDIHYEFLNGKLCGVIGHFRSFQDAVWGAEEMIKYYGKSEDKNEIPGTIIDGRLHDGLFLFVWEGRRVHAICTGDERSSFFSISSTEVGKSQKSASAPEL